MKKIIFLLFVIFASPLIDAHIIKNSWGSGWLRHTSCNGCTLEDSIYSCASCDNENHCTAFCKSVECEVSDYTTSNTKCKCSKCKK